jgi:RNA polymerase sigma-70 factor (ECF subfamily)
MLSHAHGLGSIGRFQLEAAIQSAHCARARSGATDWRALILLHRALIGGWPTIGAAVSLAAVIGRADGPESGLAALDRIPAVDLESFQPAWAARAHLLAEAGRTHEAEAAYGRAIELAAEPSVRRHLRACRAALTHATGRARTPAGTA